jgi:hypothetical protein
LTLRLSHAATRPLCVALALSRLSPWEISDVAGYRREDLITTLRSLDAPTQKLHTFSAETKSMPHVGSRTEVNCFYGEHLTSDVRNFATTKW